ncbi:11030_t:CDS:2, partial [Scutellospora calospora]
MDWDSTKRDLERDYTFQDVDKSQQGMYRPQQYMTRPQQNMRRPRDKQPRVKEACYGCFKRHCKCNNIKPCERCKKIGLPCTTKRTKSSSEANLTIERGIPGQANGFKLLVGVDVSALSFDVTDALSTDVAESSLRAYQDKPTMDMVSNGKKVQLSLNTLYIITSRDVEESSQ